MPKGCTCHSPTTCNSKKIVIFIELPQIASTGKVRGKGKIQSYRSPKDEKIQVLEIMFCVRNGRSVTSYTVACFCAFVFYICIKLYLYIFVFLCLYLYILVFVYLYLQGGMVLEMSSNSRAVIFFTACLCAFAISPAFPAKIIFPICISYLFIFVFVYICICLYLYLYIYIFKGWC